MACLGWAHPARLSAYRSRARAILSLPQLPACPSSLESPGCERPLDDSKSSSLHPMNSVCNTGSTSQTPWDSLFSSIHLEVLRISKLALQQNCSEDERRRDRKDSLQSSTIQAGAKCTPTKVRSLLHPFSAKPGSEALWGAGFPL